MHIYSSHYGNVKKTPKLYKYLCSKEKLFSFYYNSDDIFKKEAEDYAMIRLLVKFKRF